MALDFKSMTTDVDFVVRRLKQSGMTLVRDNGHKIFELPLHLVRDRNKRRWQISGTPSDTNACRQQLRDLDKVMKDLPAFMGCSTRHDRYEFQQAIHVSQFGDKLVNALSSVVAKPIAPPVAEPEIVEPEPFKPTAVAVEKKLSAVPEAFTGRILNPFHAQLRTEVAKYTAEANRVKEGIEADQYLLEEIKERIAKNSEILNKSNQWIEQAQLLLLSYEDVAPLTTVKPTVVPNNPVGQECSISDYKLYGVGDGDKFCNRGTKGCTVDHPAPGARLFELQNHSKIRDLILQQIPPGVRRVREQIEMALKKLGYQVAKGDVGYALSYLVTNDKIQVDRSKGRNNFEYYR